MMEVLCSASAIVTALRTLSKDSWVIEGEDDGPYINVCLDVAKLDRLWLAIRGILAANPAWHELRSSLAKESGGGMTISCSIISTCPSRWMKFPN